MTSFISKLQDEFAVKSPADAVEILAKPDAIQIVLHITRIEAIENVVNTKSNPRMFVLYGKTEPAQYLEIRRNKSWEPQLIPWPHKISGLIDG
jgi:hypothetical protein